MRLKPLFALLHSGKCVYAPSDVDIPICRRVGAPPGARTHPRPSEAFQHVFKLAGRVATVKIQGPSTYGMSFKIWLTALSCTHSNFSAR